MFFKQFNSNGYLSYVTVCDTELVGAIIDPSHQSQPYLDYIQSTGFKILYVVETHSHPDRPSVAAEVAQALGAKRVVFNKAKEQESYTGRTTGQVDILLEEGQRLQMGGVFLEAIYTPGYTKDSMCLLSNGRIYTGGTLLIGKCGRTDLPDGSSEEMYHSLFDKLLSLSNDLIIYPGYDDKGNINSAMGYERVNNVALNKSRTLTEFDDFIKSLYPAAK